MTSPAPRRAILGSFLLMAAADPNPDASLWIEELQLGLFGRSSSVGGGRLRFRGEIHPFSIEGLSTSASGIHSIRMQGEVFGLSRLEHFPGTYRPMPQNNAPTDGPVDVCWLRSQRGVRLRLRSTRAGAALRFGEGGLTIGLDG
jgi:hypothetical protein